MIRHVVMLKFKADADPAKIDLFIEEVKKLSHLNREVRDYSHGKVVHTRFHSGDFDFANCCDIDSYEAMERYMSHWSHLRMTPFLPDILENMMSFDWEIDYHGPAFDDALAAEERSARRPACSRSTKTPRKHTSPKCAARPASVRSKCARRRA
jgi:hypothetical protein